MQVAIAIGQVLVNLGDAASTVVKVVQASIGEFGIEAAQFGEVEGIVLAVIDTGEESHQAAGAARGGMIIDRRFDDSQRGLAPATISIIARSNSSR